MKIKFEMMVKIDPKQCELYGEPVPTGNAIREKLKELTGDLMATFPVIVTYKIEELE